MRQFNFARNWRRKIAPLLDNPKVQLALQIGLSLARDYISGDPPWECGRGYINGQIARKGCLSWYQPWGRCHQIAPFAHALGQELYPELDWGFASGEFHTVAVGGDGKEPKIVMDILLFKQFSAKESLDFVHKKNPKYHPTLIDYISSFTEDPETTLPHLKRMLWEHRKKSLKAK